jgi:transcriptional regulator with XRE-family HTH domain
MTGPTPRPPSRVSWPSWFYTLRTRAGLTQTELARRMRTTQSSIARIEGGGSLPTLDMLSRLAHATGSTLRLAAPGVSDIDLGGAA